METAGYFAIDGCEQRGYSASVTQMQEYAACVGTVYPQTSPDSVIWYKALFVIALVGMAVGIYREYKESWCSQWPDFVLAGLFGFILAPLAVLAVYGLFGGVVWLFS